MKKYYSGIVSLMFVFAAAWLPCVHAEILFYDSFDNGIVNNVDGESPDFYAQRVLNRSPQPTYIYSESGGKLSMDISVDTVNGAPSMALYASELHDHTFLTGPKTYAVRGLSIEGTGPADNAYNYHFGLSSLATDNAYGLECARLGIRIRGNGTAILYRSDEVEHGPTDDVRLAYNENVGDNFLRTGKSITGFELTLDGSSWLADNSSGGLAWDLRFSYEGDPSENSAFDTNGDGWISSADTSEDAGYETMTGTMTSADTTDFITAWLNDQGLTLSQAADAKTGFSHLAKITTQDDNMTLNVTIDEMQITAIPEPGSALFMIIGAIVLVVRGGSFKKLLR